MRQTSDMRKTWLLLLLAISVTACAGPSGPRRIEEAGPYTHVSTDLVFPEKIGVFRRQYVTEYDEEGYDASGHYQSPRTLLITATVYHYPANQTASPPTNDEFVSHFRQVVGDVDRTTPGGRLVTTEKVTYEINTFNFTGLHSAYAYDSFRGYNSDVRTHIYLFVLDGWYLKFRFTHPADVDEGATIEEINMMKAMKWPIPPLTGREHPFQMSERRVYTLPDDRFSLPD
jgi:hypothetical protein